MRFVYSIHMTQLVSRVDDSLVATVDDLVAQGLVESRSAAVRQGLEALVRELVRKRDDRLTVEAYTREPLPDDDLDAIDASAARMIAEEPW